MATSIYINTDLKDLTANAVANINRPTQVVRLPQIVEGEISDIALHLVKSNGEYDSRSGTAVDVEVSISAKGKSATSGTFKLNAGIESTGNLSWNASAEAVAGALNALNSGSGAYGSQVAVSKLANGSYRVIFDDVGERVDMAGQSIDLAPESTIGVSTSVVGSPSIRAQQVIEISQQPAIFSETWASAGSTWTGQLDANTARVQELIAAGADAFFEVKVGTDVVCQVPISILPSVAAPNSFPAHTLPDNLDAFAANPTTNGFFNPANWREDLNLVVGEDVQAWSTNLDEVAAKMSWNNLDKTFDIETGSNGVVIQVSQELLIYCRNPSGVELVDGDVVKISGATGGRPNIEKAIADNVEDARSTIGVVTQTISNNSFGFIAIEGKVRGLSFPNGSFNEGDVLYLSDTTAGAFTKTEPDISVEIGRVVRTGNNNGEILVSIQNEASLYELKQLVGKLAGNNTWTGTNQFDQSVQINQANGVVFDVGAGNTTAIYPSDLIGNHVNYLPESNGVLLNGNNGYTQTAANAKFRPSTTAVTATSYTTSETDLIVLVNETAETNINLIAAATAGNGFTITIKKVGNIANVIIDGNDSETIDGSLTQTLSSQYEALSIISDGSKWHIVSSL